MAVLELPESPREMEIELAAPSAPTVAEPEIEENQFYRVIGKSTVMGWLQKRNEQGVADLHARYPVRLLEIKRVGEAVQQKRVYATFSEWLADIGATSQDVVRNGYGHQPRVPAEKGEISHDSEIVMECMRRAQFTMGAPIHQIMRNHLTVINGDGEPIPLWCDRAGGLFSTQISQPLNNKNRVPGANTFEAAGITGHFKIYSPRARWVGDSSSYSFTYHLLYDSETGFTPQKRVWEE